MNVFFLRLPPSRRCGGNLCAVIAGNKGARLPLLHQHHHSSPPPPLSSVTIYPLSHFISPSDAQTLSAHFIFLQLFAAISPLPRLSLIPPSPALLSPWGEGEGGGRGRA